VKRNFTAFNWWTHSQKFVRNVGIKLMIYRDSTSPYLLLEENPIQQFNLLDVEALTTSVMPDDTDDSAPALSGIQTKLSSTTRLPY
jgi:hypothetical protein